MMVDVRAAAECVATSRVVVMTVGGREGEEGMRGNAMVAHLFLLTYRKTTAANTSLQPAANTPPNICYLRVMYYRVLAA